MDVNVTFYEGKPWQAVLPHGLTTWTMSFDRCGTILKDLVRVMRPRGSAWPGCPQGGGSPASQPPYSVEHAYSTHAAHRGQLRSTVGASVTPAVTPCRISQHLWLFCVGSGVTHGVVSTGAGHGRHAALLLHPRRRLCRREVSVRRLMRRLRSICPASSRWSPAERSRSDTPSRTFIAVGRSFQWLTLE